MFVQALLEQVFNFIKWILSGFPILALPGLDISPIYAVVDLATAIVPAEAIALSLTLAGCAWCVRGLMLVVRWVLRVVRG